MTQDYNIYSVLSAFEHHIINYLHCQEDHFIVGTSETVIGVETIRIKLRDSANYVHKFP